MKDATTVSSLARDPAGTVCLSEEDFLALWHAELKHMMRPGDRTPPPIAPGMFMGNLYGTDIFIDGVHVVRSDRTGRVVCGCGKGYANERHGSEHFGICKICYQNGLTRRELRAKGLKRL